jgi:ABC-2 type transport system permease protein
LLASPIDWTQLASGAFSGLAYATVFGLAAWWRFATKDITS